MRYEILQRNKVYTIVLFCHPLDTSFELVAFVAAMIDNRANAGTAKISNVDDLSACRANPPKKTGNTAGLARSGHHSIDLSITRHTAAAEPEIVPSAVENHPIPIPVAKLFGNVHAQTAGNRQRIAHPCSDQ